MGGFGGGSLEHPRQWLGAQRPGLFLGVPEPPGAFRRALRRHKSRAGALARLHFDHAEVRKSSSVMRPAWVGVRVRVGVGVRIRVRVRVRVSARVRVRLRVRVGVGVRIRVRGRVRVSARVRVRLRVRVRVSVHLRPCPSWRSG